MNIYIHYGGIDYITSHDSGDSIMAIKSSIAAGILNDDTGTTVQVPTQYQHLLYNFAELVDANTISSYGIQKYGMIYLVRDIAGFSQPELTTFLNTLIASFTPLQAASADLTLLTTDFILLGATSKAQAARGLLTQIHILDTMIPLAVDNPAYTTALTLDRTNNVNTLISTLNTTDAPQVSCFLASAPVLTPTGYVKIATLKEGDHVMTGDGRSVPIQRLKKLRVAAGPSVNPYIVPKGIYGATKRLLISPNHKIDTGAGLHQAKTLGLQQEAMSGYFDYYNLELPDWSKDTMVVAGVTVESMASIRRITVTMAEFTAMVRQQYGSVTPALLQKLRATVRFLPDGRVDIPVIRR